MTNADSLARRIAELESEVAELRAERAAAADDGAMLKTLIEELGRRRAVEEQLRQAEEWLTLAQEAGRVAAYTFDFRTGRLDWSPSTMALYGFPQGEQPTLERWLGAIHPDDRPAVQAVAESALQHFGDVDQRFRLLRADGSIHWIQDRGRIHFDDEGRPVRLVGINIDVTELVELERRATEQGERLRLALAAGRNACWDWDVATGQVTWDTQLNALTGVADFGGSFESFWALVHDDDKPRVQAALDRALGTAEDYSVEFRMKRPDGSVRWTFTQAKVVCDEQGRPVRLVGVDSDITESKIAQNALLESRLFLMSVLGASPDCIKVIEADGTLSYMNANGQAVMEIGDFSAVAGRPWVELWPQESAPLVRDALATALGGRRSRFEGPCPTAAGTSKYWDVSVSPIFGEDGSIDRIVSISRDVTDRRHAEEQLRLLNAELHHRIMNLLATVQALSRATLRASSDPHAFDRAFSGRLEALGQTYTLLRAQSDEASLGDLVEAELRPFGDFSDQLRFCGTEILLSSSTAVSIGMILHELATNASKYGALAHDGGTLGVEWRRDGDMVVLRWEERMAPAVKDASKPGGGFGSTLIDRLVRQLRGTIARDWIDRGLTVELRFPNC
ncbi:sensor histidine kinase [Sphingomonas astaxanthinifaciens]|uniref:histidine kinase n=1 Tax=Sphingomonas astaxanthinifaciens DSM 22298 TaxID=1123267 RepID=A0ABQ5Z6S5_9SPHN|nr:PAS domain-containing protein [Sphingomonas astaxanthinifaciens]GLR47232.1 hypothetical protein GCM10007925_09430 [Sphingomonas astaxanthinifaciens DSM 22298]